MCFGILVRKKNKKNKKNKRGLVVKKYLILNNNLSLN